VSAAVALVFAAALAAAHAAAGTTSVHAAMPTAACSVGRWIVDDGELFERVRTKHLGGEVGHGTAVSLIGDRLSIEGVCPETPARLTRRRHTTKVTATWRSCGGFGRVRLVGTLRGDGCGDFRGRIVAKRPRFTRRFGAARTLGDPNECTVEDTFAVLQSRLFGGCRVAACHGAARSGGLDLRADVAHASLVGQPATNTTAAAAGRQRVVAGDPDASFLWQKLLGRLDPGEGTRMPSAGRMPTVLELEMVRAWIMAGAPRTGVVESAPCLPSREYVPADPLAPPPRGHQIVFDGPTLAPGEEFEGCIWVDAPFAGDFVVGSFEYSLNPGTHHVTLYEHADGPPPALNVFDPHDLGCGAQGAGAGISNVGETPYFVDGYPPGAGRRLAGSRPIGINPHYYNEFDVPIQAKIWINLHPVRGPLVHEVRMMNSAAAELDGETSYSFSVPAFATATHRLRTTNATGVARHLFQLWGHQHLRGTRFTAWSSAGARIYESVDWAHPAIVEFDPPFVLAPGDWIDFECEWDNGVTRPVRRCGDSDRDAGCTSGEAVAVGYGVRAQDEMCTLTALYWTE